MLKLLTLTYLTFSAFSLREMKHDPSSSFSSFVRSPATLTFAKGVSLGMSDAMTDAIGQ
jgi:hypothetical protein